MLCPICLRTVSGFQQFTASGSPEIGYRCPECKQSVSPRYVQDYGDYPPVVMNLIGHRGHGKTVYLAGLLLAMRKWAASGFSYQPLDEAALLATRRRTDELQNRQVPESTPVAFQEPTILRIHPWRDMGASHLVIYDGGGEAFEQTVTLMRNRDYLARSSTVVWLLSLADLKQPQDELMHLQAVYADAVSRLQGNTRRQYLLVVLTKGDLLLSEPGFPAQVNEFLHCNEEEIHSHTEQLAGLSDGIQHWLEGDPRYSNFAHTAAQNFAEVRYCVVSATGSRPEAGRLLDAPNPTGVLAPIYWLQNFQIPKVLVSSPSREPANRSSRLGSPAPQVYTSLVEAVEKALPDAQIELMPGDHYVKQPVAINRPLSLSGKRGATRVICKEAGFALTVANSGRIKVSGIDFICAGSDSSVVGWVSEGSPEFQHCGFSGAVAERLSEHEISGGSGLMFTGTAAGKVSGCRISGNQHAGVHVMDQAKPLIEKCVIESNDWGVFYDGAGSGYASGNRCNANRRSGMRIGGRAWPVLAGNECSHNAAYGFEIGPDARPDLSNQKLTFEGNQVAAVLDNRNGLAATWRLLKQSANPLFGKAKAALKQAGASVPARTQNSK